MRRRTRKEIKERRKDRGKELTKGGLGNGFPVDNDDSVLH